MDRHEVRRLLDEAASAATVAAAAGRHFGLVTGRDSRGRCGGNGLHACLRSDLEDSEAEQAARRLHAGRAERIPRQQPAVECLRRPIAADDPAVRHRDAPRAVRRVDPHRRTRGGTPCRRSVRSWRSEARAAPSSPCPRDVQGAVASRLAPSEPELQTRPASRRSAGRGPRSARPRERQRYRRAIFSSASRASMSSADVSGRTSLSIAAMRPSRSM